MHRGEFDRKVTISVITESSDAYGDQIKTASSTVERWASKKYGTGKEDVEADRIAPILKVVWTFDFVSGLKEADTISDRDGQVYDIQTIEELDRKRYQRCNCVQRR